MAKHFKNMQEMLDNEVAAMFNATDLCAWLEDTGAFPEFSDAVDAFEVWASCEYEGMDVEAVIAKHYLSALAGHMTDHKDAVMDAVRRFGEDYRF